jgi:hypothetical protein
MMDAARTDESALIDGVQASRTEFTEQSFPRSEQLHHLKFIAAMGRGIDRAEARDGLAPL